MGSLNSILINGLRETKTESFAGSVEITCGGILSSGPPVGGAWLAQLHKKNSDNRIIKEKRQCLK